MRSVRNAGCSIRIEYLILAGRAKVEYNISSREIENIKSLFGVTKYPGKPQRGLSVKGKQEQTEYLKALAAPLLFHCYKSTMDPKLSYDLCVKTTFTSNILAMFHDLFRSLSNLSCSTSSPLIGKAIGQALWSVGRQIGLASGSSLTTLLTTKDPKVLGLMQAFGMNTKAYDFLATYIENLEYGEVNKLSWNAAGPESNMRAGAVREIGNELSTAASTKELLSRGFMESKQFDATYKSYCQHNNIFSESYVVAKQEFEDQINKLIMSLFAVYTPTNTGPRIFSAADAPGLSNTELASLNTAVNSVAQDILSIVPNTEHGFTDLDTISHISDALVVTLVAILSLISNPRANSYKMATTSPVYGIWIKDYLCQSFANTIRNRPEIKKILMKLPVVHGLTIHWDVIDACIKDPEFRVKKWDAEFARHTLYGSYDVLGSVSTADFITPEHDEVARPAKAGESDQGRDTLVPAEATTAQAPSERKKMIKVSRKAAAHRKKKFKTLTDINSTMMSDSDRAAAKRMLLRRKKTSPVTQLLQKLWRKPVAAQVESPSTAPVPAVKKTVRFHDVVQESSDISEEVVINTTPRSSQAPVIQNDDPNGVVENNLTPTEGPLPGTSQNEGAQDEHKPKEVSNSTSRLVKFSPETAEITEITDTLADLEAKTLRNASSTSPSIVPQLATKNPMEIMRVVGENIANAFRRSTEEDEDDESYKTSKIYKLAANDADIDRLSDYKKK